jgi:hypothetical protein
MPLVAIHCSVTLRASRAPTDTWRCGQDFTAGGDDALGGRGKALPLCSLLWPSAGSHRHLEPLQSRHHFTRRPDGERGHFHHPASGGLIESADRARVLDLLLSEPLRLHLVSLCPPGHPGREPPFIPESRSRVSSTDSGATSRSNSSNSGSSASGMLSDFAIALVSATNRVTSCSASRLI